MVADTVLQLSIKKEASRSVEDGKMDSSTEVPLTHVHIRKSKSRRRTLLNGVPQGSVISLALFNLYPYDIPATVLRKYIMQVALP